MQTSPTALVPATGFRARLGEVSVRLLPQIRRHLAAAGMGRAGDLDDQATEVLQEVMLEALRSESKYDPARDLRSWLNGIAGNVVRRRVERFGKVRRRLPPEPPPDLDPAEALHEQLLRAGSGSPSANPDDVAVRREEVAAALTPLSEQDRQVLLLYYFEHDEDNEAVARALGIRPGAAATRRCRALQAARKGSSR